MNKKENIIKSHPYLFAVLAALAAALVIFAGIWKLSKNRNANEAAATDEYVYEPTEEERLEDLQYELPVTGTDENGEAKELIPAGKDKTEEANELAAGKENKKTEKKKKSSDKEKNADNGIVVEIEGEDSEIKPLDGENKGNASENADVPAVAGNSDQSGNETDIIPISTSDDNGNKPGGQAGEITPSDDKPGDKPGNMPGDKPGNMPGDKPGNMPGDKPAPAPGKNKSKPRIIQEGNKQDKELPLLSIE